MQSKLKLIDALNILKQPTGDDPAVYLVCLACGFTPLDLKIYLAAYLRREMGNARVEIETGLFGDLIGTLERLDSMKPSAVAVVVEWADLDARLGLRALGGWRASSLDDILQTVRVQANRLAQVIGRLAVQVPVAVSLPTLPVPPVSYVPRHHEDRFATSLRAQVEEMGLALVRGNGKCRLVSRERLDVLSPMSERLDVRSDLATGFPYRGHHASAVAELLASLILPRMPKKGLITDLDDTLWLGIVGEVGIDGIGWTLEKNAQAHGLYQQFLQSVGDSGVLIAVASKNDAELIERALAHPELVLSRKALMPVEAGWGRKSEAVARILQIWNIGADAVVFVDDSATEVAEVQVAFPFMDCRVFPRDDPNALWNLIGELRDLFGRFSISEEDRLRSDSIAGSVGQADAIKENEIPSADFLRKAEAQISIAYSIDPQDARPLKLINKTNQFNLNGLRPHDADWLQLLNDPQTVVMVVGYRDRFGPLGRIAVLVARSRGNRVEILHCVMSCRAFSRQIEHACLAHLFAKTGVEELEFDLAATERNGPLRKFLVSFIEDKANGHPVLTRERFHQACPQLFHQLEVV